MVHSLLLSSNQKVTKKRGRNNNNKRPSSTFVTCDEDDNNNTGVSSGTTRSISQEQQHDEKLLHSSNHREKHFTKNSSVKKDDNDGVAQVSIATKTSTTTSTVLQLPPPSIPIRNCDFLYASHITVHCALVHHCIPCAYKVGLFDVALDHVFCKQIPNQRPELCPRSLQQQQQQSSLMNERTSSKTRTSSNTDTTKRIICGALGTLGYSSMNMNVLTVGDGDFTFSLALARIMLSSQNDDVVTSNRKKQNDNHTTTSTRSSTLVATSYESLETLLKVYPNINETIQELEALGVDIYYNVDATQLKKTLIVASSKTPLPCTKKQQQQINEKEISLQHHHPYDHYFHRIVWNFPCEAVEKGQDGQNKEMERNQILIQKFVSNAQSFLINPTTGTSSRSSSSSTNSDQPIIQRIGQIHINHKTKPPYNQWNIEDYAVGGNINHNNSNGKNPPEKTYYYSGRIVFDRCLFPPYIPRKALDKKSFPTHDACTYIFSKEEVIASEKEYTPLNPHPIRNDCSVVKDGTNQLLPLPTTDEINVNAPDPSKVVRVTPTLITKIRQTLMELHSTKETKVNTSKKTKYYK